MNKFPIPPPDRRIKERKSIEENKEKLDNTSKHINYSGNSSMNYATNPNQKNSFNYIRENNSYQINHVFGSNSNNNVNKNNEKNPFPMKNSENKSMNFLGSNNLKTNLNSYYTIYNSDHGGQDEREEYDKLNNINILKIKHIEDMRNNILSYKILNEKKMFLTSISNVQSLNTCNIILFGPSGSGKSSFIKTLYRAVYGTSFLPPEAVNKLIIKETDANEGTLCFTRLHLKEESSISSGILVCDTRGHILMNEMEKEQFKVIVEGKIKENIEIKQIQSRNPILLWEFWKKDSQIFPKEIFAAKEVGLESIPHSIVFVFDGSKDQIIDQDDIQFYKELITLSLKKGYNSLHIILTRIDVFEKNIFDRNKNLTITERTGSINKLKDQKIAEIIDLLDVKRSHVHFIENYHSNVNENLIEIDYQALKTLGDIINVCEEFIINNLNRNATCLAKCF